MDYLIRHLLIATGLLIFADVIAYGQNSSGIASGCYGNDTGSPVCFTAYRDRSAALKSWTDASALCNGSFGGSLPRIYSSDIQLRLAEFLYDYHFTIDSIWLGAKGTSGGSSPWQWVNGRTFPTSSVSGYPVDFSNSVAVITEDNGGNGTIVSQSIGYTADGFICQFKQGPCTGDPNDHYSVGTTCFKRFDQPGNWFSSRNKCIYGNGDLATLDDTTTTGLNEVLAQLDLDGRKKYWVGLRKLWWNWAPDMVEFNMSFFVEQPSVENAGDASGNCLTVDFKNQFAWSIRACSTPFHTVCQTTGLHIGPTSPSPDESSSSFVSLPVWAVGVICGCAGLFFIVSLIIVALIVRKCSRGSKKKKITTKRRPSTKSNRYVAPVPSIYPPQIPPPDDLSLPHQQPTTHPQHSEDAFDDFDDDDDDVYQNDIPPPTTVTTPPGGQYMNHSEAKSSVIKRH